MILYQPTVDPVFCKLLEISEILYTCKAPFDDLLRTRTITLLSFLMKLYPFVYFS